MTEFIDEVDFGFHPIVLLTYLLDKTYSYDRSMFE
jgi:hypothetical protein